MKSLSRMLILAVILPYQIIAQDYSTRRSCPPAQLLFSYEAESSSMMLPAAPQLPAADPSTFDWPTITLTSDLIDTAYIPEYSRRSALLAASVGASIAGSCVRKYGNHLPLLQQVGIALGAAIPSALASYAVTYKFLTSRIPTNLAKDQAALDRYTNLYSDTYNAHQNADIDRNFLKRHLNLEDVSVDNRLTIYALALNRRKKNPFPISNAINVYLEQRYSDIKAEEEALRKVKTDTPQFKNSYLGNVMKQIKNVMAEIERNCKIIDQANKILPKETISAWIEIAKTLPEYRAEDNPFPITYVKLLLIQDRIKSEFKSLANYNELTPTKTITDTKSSIHTLIQKYQNLAVTLNEQITAYNEQIELTPKPILSFMARYNERTDQVVNQCPINPKLLEYEPFLTEDCNEEQRQEWLNACFPEEKYSDEDNEEGDYSAGESEDFSDAQYDSE